ncbi:integral membrane protein-like protein [Ophiobolus disseminans]|uniref:Integral membrane protein-like protein n=1 Tax=Ophiobolus disseminans TaxID=1469910 RepID=A0A6A7AEF5_9PLEO|nr:integral membrane protein-like protein [Ophiobolus disseminans]
MRPTALIPATCCLVALILSFLCLFAGHKKSFMEGYHLLTLNTSVLGETLLPEDRTSSNPILNLLNTIPNEISESINDQIGDATARLGIQDFYSAHMLNYCEGQYTPAEVPNATVSESDISKNVTSCGKSRAMYRFDPTQIIQNALSKSGLNVSLKDLKWPEDIQSGIDALNALMSAMFVLYVLAICLIFVTLVAAVFAILTSGRLSACLNFVVAILAFLAIGLASALVTAVMIKGTGVINQYGNDIGLEAKWGGKFLALTWAATALMFVVVVVWVVEVCVGRRKKTTYAKHG